MPQDEKRFGLLPNTFGIMFYPALGVALGNGPTSVTKAILIQQIHYWCCRNKAKQEDGANQAYRNGHWWVYQSVSGWARRIPCIGEQPIARVLKELRADRIVIAEALDEANGRQMLWYRIDYDRLAVVLRSCEATANETLDDFGLSKKDLY